jgi:hypothetical protein
MLVVVMYDVIITNNAEVRSSSYYGGSLMAGRRTKQEE